MMRISLAVTVALTCASGAYGSEKFKLIHADDLAALQTKKAPVVVFDANLPDFRAKHGIIPGARLLSSFNEYDVTRELPPDKKTALVFYCANAH